jgi:formylglycine-generating enzyme required for sulfatase activity
MVGPVNPKELINFVGMRFVRMPGYDHYIGKYTVTHKEWVAVLGTKPWKGKSNVKEGDDHPATYISWNDCQELVDKLNSRGGRKMYRLPTEEEWEYACLAGSTTKYCFGDDAAQLGDYAWYSENAFDVGEKYAHEVGQKLPNDWGLYDMHGNIWEWTSTPAEDGSRHISRGGGLNSTAHRCLYRYRFRSEGRCGSLGVRLVMS